MPITTIKGGIKAFRMDILYPIISIVAKLQITPSITTVNDIHIALKDRKKNKRIRAERRIEAKMNIFISFTIRRDSIVRICGKPL